ncbi:MAG TPA: hypothetical protein VLG44_02930 [Chlamydiales bacterium]|nr:hypothetical protein [Chlamydiales bacterium]
MAVSSLCTRFTNCFSSCSSQTPQAKVDRELFIPKLLINLNKALRSTSPGTLAVKIVNIFPRSPLVKLAGVGASSYILPGSWLTIGIGAVCAIEWAHLTYDLLKDKGDISNRVKVALEFQLDKTLDPDQNIRRLENLLFEKGVDGHRDFALINLHELETAYHDLPQHAGPSRSVKLKVLREFITKAEITPISYPLYHRMVLARLMKQGLTPENKALWRRMEKFYREDSIHKSTSRQVLQCFVENAETELSFSFRYSPEIDAMQAYIPHLTVENFFSNLHRFLDKVIKINLCVSADRNTALDLITDRYEVMRQFFNFYKEHKSDFVIFDKQFVHDSLLDCSRHIFEMHAAILQSHPEVPNDSESSHSDDQLESEDSSRAEVQPVVNEEISAPDDEGELDFESM